MGWKNYLAAVLSMVALPSFAENLIIGTVQTYDAGVYTVDPEAFQSFERELGDELCRRASVSCKWKVVPADQMLSSLSGAEIDAVMAGISATTDVGKDYVFTMAYLYPDPFSYLGRGGEMKDSIGGVVPAVTDYDLSGFSATSGVTFKKHEALDEAISAMLDGQFEAVFAEKERVAPLIAASNGTLGYAYFKDMKVVPGVGMLFRADDIDRRFLFEDQIFEMTQDGSLNQLSEKWFGANDFYPW